MAIRSHAFGGVTLTDKDAVKFENQVRYGKPKPAAAANVKKGIELLRQMQSNGGKLSITLKRG